MRPRTCQAPKEITVESVVENVLSPETRERLAALGATLEQMIDVVTIGMELADERADWMTGQSDSYDAPTGPWKVRPCVVRNAVAKYATRDMSEALLTGMANLANSAAAELWKHLVDKPLCGQPANETRIVAGSFTDLCPSCSAELGARVSGHPTLND